MHKATTMYLSRIIVSNFKNITGADISFSPKINCICGDNGEGKTNFLDAVYYLSMTKSFLSSSDRYTFTYGKDEAVLHGDYAFDGGVEDIAVSLRSDGNKTVRHNGKAYKRISEHIGKIPVVMTAPSDVALIHDSGEERRRFLNMMISQMDQEPVQDILLDTVSERMFGFSECIYEARDRVAGMLNERTASFYGLISEGKETVEIRYRSDLSGGTGTAELFASSVQKDKVMGFTTSGVQRDDLEFLMDGYPVRRCSSQGQQKSFLLALKMAQYSVMREVSGVRPILLFDDLFDKLDAGRVASLIKMVSGGDFGQIFITHTDETRLRGIIGGITDQCKYFSVCRGQVRSS